MSAQPRFVSVWLVSNAFLGVLAVLVFSYKYLDDLARHHPEMLRERLFTEGTGFGAALIVLPIIVWAGLRLRFDRAPWWRVLPAHVGIAVAASLTHTTLMGVSRSFLAPRLGMGAYNYGDMRFRYPMEMAQFLIIYALAISGLHVYYYQRAARDRQLAAAELQTRLAQAQLHNLQLQLQPHFLFNALNTISSVMYEDVRRADAMLVELSGLLRETLRRPDVQEIPLEEEIKLLRLYLRIMEERFGDQLRVEVAVDPRLSGVLVPQLLLQPLVENSIRHGAGATPLSVRVTAARHNGSLLLQVSDNGPGIANAGSGEFRRGIGLSTTADRLQALYGAQQELRFENGAGGGLNVIVLLPLREEP